MQCPHCSVEMHFREKRSFVYQREIYDIADSDLEVAVGSCTECRKPVVLLRTGECSDIDGVVELVEVKGEEILYPQ